jgi:outer membrane protein assembly factor BamB
MFVVAHGTSRRLVAIAAGDGQQQWDITLPGDQPVDPSRWYTSNRGLIVTNGNILSVLDPATGAQTVAWDLGAVIAAVADAGPDRVAVHAPPFVKMVSTADGSVLWSYQTASGYPTRLVSAWSDGIVVATGGDVVAFEGNPVTARKIGKVGVDGTAERHGLFLVLFNPGDRNPADPDADPPGSSLQVRGSLTPPETTTTTTKDER